MSGKFHKDNTIQSKSSLYFLTSSQWARDHFLYIQSYGHFLCDQRYAVRNREPFESLLCIVTLDGSGVIKTDRGVSTVKANDIALIDCRTFHEYYAPKHWEFDFVHFSGAFCYEISDLFLELSGNILSPSKPIYSVNYIKKIAESKQLAFKRIQEIEYSRYLTDFLSELIECATSIQYVRRSNQIEAVLTYIKQHFKEKITMKELAVLTQTSISSFEHSFQKVMGYSPYHYILNLRMDQAKYLLTSTSMDISEICYDLGFNSPAHFIRLFREKSGITPGEFRKKLLYSPHQSDDISDVSEISSHSDTEEKEKT